MDIREEFEAWMMQSMLAHGWGKDSVALVFLPSTIPGLTYSTVSTEHAWTGYQAGRRAGEESMRERAAKVCRNVLERGDAIDRDEVYAALHNEGDASACEFAIRALPIGGE